MKFPIHSSGFARAKPLAKFHQGEPRFAAGEISSAYYNKGRPPRILSQEDLRNIQALVDSGENALSAREIGARLGLECHETVIWRALKELGNTFKKSLIASERNREDVLEARQNWSIWIKQCRVPAMFFLDETGIKTNIPTSYVWSKKGKRCFGYAPGAWKNYAIPAAIGVDKIVQGILIDGTLDKSAFKYFMENVLLPQLPKGAIVGMDNLSVHKHSFDMKLFIKKDRNKVLTTI